MRVVGVMADEVTFSLASPEDTDALGFALGEAIDEPLVIGLVGEMGSGKTTLVRGLARGLGVSGVVNSPTYTLLQRYEGRMSLNHLDAWMEAREREVLADGAHELLGKEGVSVVEWADRVEDWLPPERLEVQLVVTGANERRAVVRWLTDVGAAGPSRALEAMHRWVVPESGDEG